MILSAKWTGSLAGLVLAVSLLVAPGPALATTYYVNGTTGSDAPEPVGTSAGSPWKTITYAATHVPAGTAGAPNVIMVADGTYNVSANDEIFPITFANDFVSLTAAGPGKPIIDRQDGSAAALYVEAKGFSISGFAFKNTSDAINFYAGGFTVDNNSFANTVTDGVNFYMTETDYATNISFADMAIKNNTFSTTQNGIYVDVEIDFDSSARTASFGDFTITGNTFNLPSGDGIYLGNLFSPNDIAGGTVTIGSLKVTGNTITGGDNGIYFWGKINNMEDTQVTVGNMEVSDNTCTNQSAAGIDINYWDLGYFSGSSSAGLGGFKVTGNTVQATNYVKYPGTDGISIFDIDHMEYIYDQTTVNTGNVEVKSNTVDVDGPGIYLYSNSIDSLGEQNENDSVSVTTGSHTVSGNTINSNNSWGLYIDLSTIGSNLYGTSALNYGGYSVSGNTVTSERTPFYFYVSGLGDNLYENATVSLGPVSITGNTLTANNNFDGMEFYFDAVANNMDNNASLTMSPFTIDNNSITATGNGIDIYYEDYTIGDMDDTATATLPGWNITDNIIDTTNGTNGVYFHTYGNPYYNGGSAMIHFGSMNIDNNTFNPNKDTGMAYGIYLYIDDLLEEGYDSCKTTFGDITVTGNTLYAIESEAIYIEHNETGYAFYNAPTLTIGNIEIGGNTIDKTPIGIDLYFYRLFAEASANVSHGLLNIHDNILSNISENGIYVSYYNVNDDPTTATLNIGAPAISGNTVSGKPASLYGIYLEVDNSTGGITFGMPVLSGNAISGFDYGINLDSLDRVDAASLSCNFLENNNLAGIRFGSSAGTDITVKTNSFVDNTVGLMVANGNATVINAERNWWGDVAGPVACASCNGVNPGDSGTVDYTPWLTYQPDKARCGKSFPWLMFVPAITGMGN